MSNMPPMDPISAATSHDPYDFYGRLVVERPVYYDEGLRLWVAASARAVADVLAHPHCRVRPASEPVPQALVGSAAGDIFGSLVRMSDGERHTALKRAVDRAFENLPRPAGERTAAEQAGRLAREAIDAGDGRAVTAFSFRFPIYVMARLLGIPDTALAGVADATTALAVGLAPVASVEQRDDASAAAERLRAVVSPLVPAETSNTASGESVLDAFRRATHHDAPNDSRIVDNGIGFLFQTCDAMAGLIGNTIVTLGRRRDVLEAVTREPRHLRAAIEEVLRFDPSVQNTRRFVEKAGIVAGEPMEAGDAVLVLLAAANRDPAANPEPGRFDLLRANRRLFTFGTGAHACPGSTLAVTIATAGLQRLLEGGLDPRPLAEAFSYRPSVNLRVPLFTG